MSFSAQSIENSFSDIPGSAVSAVKTYLHATERVHTQRDKIADVSVSAGNVVNSSADLSAVSVGEFCPVLTESIQLAVQVSFDKVDNGVFHFLALLIDKLDTVVVVWVMACGDHDTAVESINSGNISNGGSCSNMEQVSISAGSSKTAHK